MVSNIIILKCFLHKNYYTKEWLKNGKQIIIFFKEKNGNIYFYSYRESFVVTNFCLKNQNVSILVVIAIINDFFSSSLILKWLDKKKKGVTTKKICL